MDDGLEWTVVESGRGLEWIIVDRWARDVRQAEEWTTCGVYCKLKFELRATESEGHTAN